MWGIVRGCGIVLMRRLVRMSGFRRVVSGWILGCVLLMSFRMWLLRVTGKLRSVSRSVVVLSSMRLLLDRRRVRLRPMSCVMWLL
jgi:hypothetical protein